MTVYNADAEAVAANGEHATIEGVEVELTDPPTFGDCIECSKR